jgi:hypothetical protein
MSPTITWRGRSAWTIDFQLSLQQQIRAHSLPVSRVGRAGDEAARLDRAQFQLSHQASHTTAADAFSIGSRFRP